MVRTKSKFFLLVFAIAFLANVVVVYVWERFFHGSGRVHWDTSSVIAAATAAAMTFVWRRRV